MARAARSHAAALARWGVVAVPTVLTLVLGVVDLDGRSIWLDEAATASITAQHGAALGSAMARDGGNMLGYYALVHVLVGWFGSSLVVLRLPSVIGAAATTALVVVLARRWFSRRVALVAGLFSAVSLPAVYWAQNARSYSLMMAFVAASYLSFCALVDQPEGARGGWRAFVAYVVTTTLAVYMSFIAVLVIPAQLVALVGRRRRVRPVIAAVVIVAAMCVPLAVLARLVWFGTTLLGAAPEPCRARPGPRLARLGGLPAELPPHRDGDLPRRRHRRRLRRRGRYSSPPISSETARPPVFAASSSLSAGSSCRWSCPSSSPASPSRPSRREPARLAAGRRDRARPGRGRPPLRAGRRCRPRRRLRRVPGRGARALLRRVTRALEGRHAPRPAVRRTGRLHRLLPVRRPNGVPLLPRPLPVDHAVRAPAGPAGDAVLGERPLRRAVREPCRTRRSSGSRRAARACGSSSATRGRRPGRRRRNGTTAPTSGSPASSRRSTRRRRSTRGAGRARSPSGSTGRSPRRSRSSRRSPTPRRRRNRRVGRDEQSRVLCLRRGSRRTDLGVLPASPRVRGGCSGGASRVVARRLLVLPWDDEPEIRGSARPSGGYCR